MHMEVWDLCITLFIKGNITKLNSSLLIKTYNSKHCTLKTYLVKTLEYEEKDMSKHRKTLMYLQIYRRMCDNLNFNHLSIISNHYAYEDMYHLRLLKCITHSTIYFAH